MFYRSDLVVQNCGGLKKKDVDVMTSFVFTFPIINNKNCHLSKYLSLFNLQDTYFKKSQAEFQNSLCLKSRVFLLRQIWNVNYYVKNPIKNSQ